ncbi:ATP-binding protein [Emticicia agri]|uniref:histidine kinase n=1 Tax=Emticicia agri TaxID=2492393 RepID=A0A4Q5LZF3_9BACT|nr:ATP-binding protein [Emticicia agri]RYU95254.1 PAS domain S-box protein [Emticicia agri]
MSDKRIHEFLAGGGEMGERIRNYDWSQTSLGSPEHWPQELKTCVRIMLSSQQPIWIGWGKELIKLYNDTYIDIVRGKHPVALGQPASVVWKDIWKDISPLLSKAMLKDEGTYVESQLLIMHRSGFPEETYYTFSYTPVLGDDDKPAGIICYNTTDTERIINERSLKTLQQLDSLVQKKTEKEVYIQAAKAVEFNKWDFPFALIYKINDTGDTGELVATAGFEEKHPTLPDIVEVTKPTINNESFCRAVTENRLVESYNNGRWGDLPKGAWDVVPHQFLHVPIKGANKKFPLAILSIGLNPYRQFDEVYKNFIQLTADQISLGVNNALAYEEERKRAQVLEELDKAKTLFFSNISHEFRTPITLMLGPLEELLNKPDIHLSPYERQHVEVTHRNALRLLKLVNTLLDFSRIESGRHQAHFVPTNLPDYTKNLASNFRSVIEKAGLGLVVDEGKFSKPVYVDKQMWEKIVFNLLSNAFKYTLQGTITLKIYAEGQQAMLSVEDTGVGIPAKELPHMFDRFHRVQNTAGRTHEGTGIGLSLVKELVQLHKGEIKVESKEGVGTKFTVSIPLGKTHLPNGQIQETADFTEAISNLYIDEATSFLHNKTDKSIIEQHSFDASLATILIVDDNVDMRHHIESIISTKYNTLTAGNGKEALQLIEQNTLDLILSDVMMPVMDGIELLKAVKNDCKIAHIPVILITARAGEESRIEGYETGADDYMTKPFSANELLSRVKSQLKIAHTRQEVEQRLRGFLMQAPAAIAILEGPEHVFSLTNAQFQQLIGRQAEEMLGYSLKQLFPEFEGQGIYEIFSYVYNSGEPFAANEFFASFLYKGKPRSGYWDFVIYPIKNENGIINELMVHVIESTAQVEARRKVESSERQFRNVLVQSPSIFLLLKGPDMVITFVNEPLLASWGKTSDIVGNKLLEVLPELRGQNFPILLQEVYETGEVRYGNEEKASIIKDGQIKDIYYNYVYQPIYDLDNSISGITVMATDITEQVSARKRVEASEEQFRTLAETLPQLVWMTDARGNQQYASGRWVEYTGHESSPENWVKTLHPEDFERMFQAWNHSLNTGNIYKIELRLKSKTGEYRWHYGQGEPIRNEQGEIINWIGNFMDIHEQKLFTEKLETIVKERTIELIEKNTALENSESFLQQLIDSSVEFILVIDKDFQIITVNKRFEEEIKKKREDIYGKHLFEFNPKAKGTEEHDAILSALKGETVHFNKRRAIALDNYFIDTYFIPLKIQNKIEGVIIMSRDVTDIVHSEMMLEEKNKALENTNKELESFNYIASHDLQEPLRKIRTFIHLIEKSGFESESSRKYFEKINSSAQRMSDLIQSVLTYSRLSKTGEDFTETDLNKILADVQTDFELLIKEKNATIKSGNLPTIKANNLQINQLFSNLISNSLKFSTEKPKISISSKIEKGKQVNSLADPKQSFAHLIFKDNGIGFPEEFKEKIFNLFQRLHGKSEYSGTGIGLSIVKKIVEQHKGYISAESKDGEGATFHIWLPVG